MFDLDQAVAGWHETMKTKPGIEKELLDELEDHLRQATHRAGRLPSEEAGLPSFIATCPPQA